ncbi:MULTISPECIES: DUF3553 domain-containing protein [Citrifermentans]|uniref:DUF3553 domain-containing protein n=1 Tax=Citrifermentans bemidjiense (strain ATCC BAA-1014 / DSM 16622 / JCM 12645 / Bem) TaxID=404380 RepID=B5EIP6_CITBB|nr:MULTISPECIES: DUF3553 domain-containing protein [Citrifermentans]ACH38411.1 hypothetical protein Gbem_1392 [Citrifermentans bemidjiense Bem]
MSIRRGDVVSHCSAVEWGVGKVVEVSDYRVSIHFNDGTTRKIASTHFASLVPAEPGSYIAANPVVEKDGIKAKAPRKKAVTAKQAAGAK